MGNRDETNVIVEECLVRTRDQFAAVFHRHHGQFDAGLFAQELPGDDVGMMLEMRDEDRISGAEPWPAIALRDKIHGFGRSAREDHLVAAGGVDECLDSIARALEGFGCTMA